MMSLEKTVLYENNDFQFTKDFIVDVHSKKKIKYEDILYFKKRTSFTAFFKGFLALVFGVAFLGGDFAFMLVGVFFLIYAYVAFSCITAVSVYWKNNNSAVVENKRKNFDEVLNAFDNIIKEHNLKRDSKTGQIKLY